MAEAYAKIIRRNRGGFCFEVNLLFGWLLRRLGLDARYIAARVYRGKTPSYPALTGSDIIEAQCAEWDGSNLPTHIVVLVDGTWLCDVGFGESPLMAINVRSADVQYDGQHAYRVRGDTLVVLERRSRGAPGVGGIKSEVGTWEPRILFDLNDDRPASQFELGLERVQVDETVIFRQFLMCVKQTDAAKFVLTGTRLRITPNYADDEQTHADVLPDRDERHHDGPDALLSMLTDIFGFSFDNEHDLRNVRKAIDQAFAAAPPKTRVE